MVKSEDIYIELSDRLNFDNELKFEVMKVYSKQFKKYLKSIVEAAGKQIREEALKELIKRIYDIGEAENFLRNIIDVSDLSIISLNDVRSRLPQSDDYFLVEFLDMSSIKMEKYLQLLVEQEFEFSLKRLKLIKVLLLMFDLIDGLDLKDLQEKYDLKFGFYVERKLIVKVKQLNRSIIRGMIMKLSL